MTEENKTKELDLLDLLLKFIRLIRKRIPLLISCILISGAIGTANYFITPYSYSTTMIARSNFLSDVEVEGMMTILNELIGNKNWEDLGEKMHISPNTASKIVEIKSGNIRLLDRKYTDPYKVRDSIFYVKATIIDYTIIDSLQNGLSYYMENNDYIKRKKNEYKKSFETSSGFARKYTQHLDSISKRFEEILKSTEAVNLRIDPANYYNQLNSIRETEQKRADRLKNMIALDIIEGFTKTEKPMNLGFRFILPAYLSAGFFFWLILTGVLELRLLIIRLENRDAEKKKNT